MVEQISFIHLRVHSAYSLSEGALPINSLAGLCLANRMPALAITDSNNLFGALEFSEAMASKGLQPIIGCSLSVDTGNDNGRPPVLALLAKNAAGYTNIMKLSSAAFLNSADGDEPHVTLATLEHYSDGLICLTGGPSGPVNQALVDGQRSQAEQCLMALKQMFDDRLYVELQRHATSSEAIAEDGLINLAYAMDLPLVATNEAYFATPDEFAAHDALLCIADGEVIAAEERRRMTPEHYFKTQADMVKLFADLPEALANSVEIARRCAFRPEPRAPILPNFSTGDEADELKDQARAGLKRVLAAHGVADGFTEADYYKRLDFELDVIVTMDFSGYFLIVADFIQWAKARDIPVGPGRGSGAGSVVAWALTITDLDPLRFNLIFERFLNPERISMPDFDVDFCQERRDEVISYVQQKYGADQVAQIITFGKLQARAVCRDVGRVLQMPYGQVDRLCKMIPNNPANPVTLQQAIDGEPRLREESEGNEAIKTMLEIGLKLEGLYRHASTHAAGLVIGDRPLDELVPLYRDPRSPTPVTQFNMQMVEKAGLVKFDFLGLKTLTVLDKARALLAERGVNVDMAALPLDDEDTYAMLQRGETVGVFQLESSGMRDLIRKSQPSNIEDIIALVALYRPGPMENIPKYIASKKGEEKPEFLHETITPLVADTYGVIIYQEQVLQIAQRLSGYTLGEADILRKAMGKKIKSEMDQQRERFVAGAVERGVDSAQANFIFDLVAKFAGYGFNKAHSACYAVVAYRTAYIKANYPVEFMAASMALDMGNTDKLQLFRREAQRLGVEIQPPSINSSGIEFVVHDGVIRYSLAALKNVGRAAVEHIVDVRDADGPFVSIGDFAARISPRLVNRRALESLARAGAFDEINPNRAQILAGVDSILASANRAQEQAAAGQADMFGAGSGAGADEMPLPAVEPWLALDRLAQEFDAVGFYISGHPLDDYEPTLNRLGVIPWTTFHEQALAGRATSAKLACTVVYRQDRRSKSGNRFAFVGLSDASGQFEAICFSDLLVTSQPILDTGKTVVAVVEADAGTANEDIRVRLVRVEPLEAVALTIKQGLEIFVRGAAPVASIAKRLSNGGGSPVRIVLQLDSAREVKVALGDHFTITPRIKSAIKAIDGVVDVRDL